MLHKGQDCIAICFDNFSSLNGAIRKYAGAKWSQTKKVWYVPLSKENHQKICNALKNKAGIDHEPLRKYLLDKKEGIQKGKVENGHSGRVMAPETRMQSDGNIHPVNARVLPVVRQQLVLKAYSPSTIKTYLNEISQLLKIIGAVPASQLRADDLRRYFAYCFEKLHIRENTLHSRINALKFYYEQVLGREKLFWEIPRPKKPLILPKLLNETELARLFNSLSNKKHKAMLFTAYSAGLRVSEIVRLRIRDIDSRRMQIFVENAKGKKDRYVNLSPVLLDILRKYIQEYRPRPKVYLFESEQTMLPYPVRTVQQIFSNAKRKARISKTVGIHSLRHSFATHLLDKGTDIKYIKELLGHFNIKTTERYLHVSKRQLVNVISPFDDLWKSENIEW